MVRGREIWPAAGGSTLLKGGRREAIEKGGVRRHMGQRGGERGVAGNVLGGRWARAVALPRYSGGTRATDRRDRATAGPGGKRRGAG
jgi:hypothetical protein